MRSLTTVLGITMAGMAVASIVGYSAGIQYQKTPNPDEWMVVKSVTVQNAKFGQDPVVVSDRTILQDFIGRWTATIRAKSVQGLAEGEYLCSASNKLLYRAGAPFPSRPVHLWSWWMFDGTPDATKCVVGTPLAVGCYTLHTKWEFDVIGFNSGTIGPVSSNTFCVTE